MPWTRKAVKLLLSKASPLTPAQQKNMKAELHADPSLGHAHKKMAAYRGETHSFDHKRPKRKVVSRYS
jgi:hypothetical protein